MKILHLTLKKRWFDMIASGEKREEYRECKPYWTKRLERRERYDAVQFRNGYRADSPTMRFELMGTFIGCGNPAWGARLIDSSTSCAWAPILQTEELTMNDDQIKHMVNRFLGWKLPENFQPDAGICFKPEYNVEHNAAQGMPPAKHQPIGTNLFDAQQAEAMVRYMLEGMPTQTTTKDELAWLVERGSPAEYRTMSEADGIHWTSDPNKAIRFARRADAEMFSEGDPDAARVCEHMWCSPATTRGGTT